MGVNLSYLDFCERARPDWHPDDGVASSFTEFLIALNGPSGYVWIAIAMFFLWKRNIIASALLVVSSLAFFVHLNGAKYNLVDDLYYGQLGGCVGSLAVANTVLLTVAMLGLIVFGFRISKRRASN